MTEIPPQTITGLAVYRCTPWRRGVNPRSLPIWANRCLVPQGATR